MSVRCNISSAAVDCYKARPSPDHLKEKDVR